MGDEYGSYKPPCCTFGTLMCTVVNTVYEFNQGRLDDVNQSGPEIESFWSLMDRPDQYGT